MSRTAASITRSRITRLSLSADPSALCVMRRFIREMARGTSLSPSEVSELQVRVAKSLDHVLTQHRTSHEGHIVLEIDARAGAINVDIRYCSDLHFPAQEFASRS